MTQPGRFRALLAAALVTLKQHRFEVAVAALAAAAVGGYSLFVETQLAATGASAECIKNYLNTGPDGREQCAGPMAAWGAIFASPSEYIAAAMKFLPFLVGLLGGVPIIAREIESRTTQTAWSLNGSRLRWLIRQVVPIAAVVLVALAFAALTAELTEQHREAWGLSAFAAIGLHGPLVLVRAFGAFGVGLLAGVFAGRSLPAFVLGVLVLAAAYLVVGDLRGRWIHVQQPRVLGEMQQPTGSGEIDEPALLGQDAATAQTTGWAWRTPDGQLISNDEALALVPPDVLALDDPIQPVHAAAWLQDRGYTLVAMGVTDQVAMGWAPYDGIAFGMVGAISIGGAIWLMNRRRPA